MWANEGLLIAFLADDLRNIYDRNKISTGSLSYLSFLQKMSSEYFLIFPFEYLSVYCGDA